jgi:CheY-like chemotaxis protein
MATILVADADDGTRRVLDMILSSEGHQVIEAANGRNALMYLQGSTPDLIIMDIQFPDMDGLELCYRVKRVSRLKHIPILVLTSVQDEQVKHNAQLGGAAVVMSKPLSGKGIRGTVSRLLGEQASH